jgi:KDO2-lipid IV(A) lauroyltransferase
LVTKNVSLALPDKSKNEISTIVQLFYHNFFDIVFETIKLLTISKDEVMKRMTKGNMSALENYQKQGNSVVLAIGHVGNWELGAAAYAIEDYPHVKGVYKVQSNKFFDNLMIRIRTRFGGGVYPMEETVDRIRENMGNQTAIGLLADQYTPNRNAPMLNFLGRQTPVLTSVEMISKRFDFPVVYLRFMRLGRGSYEMSCEVLADKPQETKKYEITHRYFRLVEQDIYEQPDNWLWTHDRWKIKDEDERKVKI